MKKTFEKKYCELVSQIDAYIPDGEKNVLEKAFQFGLEAHKNQFRRSGDPYFFHCIEAAKILADLKMDLTTIAAGLLHDIVEDTGVTLTEVQGEFGEDIAQLVNGVTKIPDLKFKETETKQAENFRKIVLSMAKDIRVVIIKFADRLHNMKTLKYLPQKKQKLIARETLDVYAPLAHRFGIAWLGWQLEDLSFQYLNHRMYNYIEKRVSEKWQDRVKYIDQMKKPIIDELNKLKIPSTIVGRPKSYFSIFRKMQEQEITFEEVYDLLAMRIITEKKEDCYAIMGVIHTLFTPVADRFKDYIATPKSNGYQSLHTAVINPGGRWMEVQIRTHAMDYTAEMGIAAHWLYKSKQSDDRMKEQLVWVRQFLDWNKENTDPDEFMQSFKIDLYNDEIFVFTPKGKLINMPVTATPVDFAFAVHTEIGLHCIGAKVNSRVVPLYTTLNNGDEVEIITSSQPNIREFWTSFVVTSRAQTHIKRWLRENRRLQYLKLGKEMLNYELEKYETNLDKIDIEQLTQKSGYREIDDLLQALGTHLISPEEIAKRVFPGYHKDEKSSLLTRIPRILRKSPKSRTQDPYITIHGDYPLVIELSTCCTPVPGDKIFGFYQKDKGVIVHRAKCKEIPKDLSKNEKWVEVEWAQKIEKEFSASIQVIAADRKHLLRDMVVVISKLNINLLKTQTEVQGIVAVFDITMEVKDLPQLKTIMNELLKIKGIQRVRR